MTQATCERKGMSRRNFLEGAGIAAIGAGLLGMAGCGSPSVASSKGSETKNAASSGVSTTGTSPYAQINPQDWDFTDCTIDDFSKTTMFSEIKFGSLTLKNRLIKSAATSMVANDEQKAVAYHSAIAAGGMGAVLIEGSYNMLSRLDAPGKVTNAEDRLSIEESPLEAICKAVHDQGVPCLIQLKTATPGIVYNWDNMGPEGETHRASLLSANDIQMYIEDSIEAAAKLQAIGFDGVDINAAGDNLPARFLSRFENDRTVDDPYGPATIESRARICTELIAGIKQRCGQDFVVQVLVNGAEENDGSLGDSDLCMTKEEIAAICQALEAAGADALELRLGTFQFHETQFVGDAVWGANGLEGSTGFGTFFNFNQHFGGLLDGSHSGCGLIMNACKYVKQFVKIPVGGVVFMDPALAPDYFEQALNDGAIDTIYMHRPVSNADKDYANKLREGRIDEIRPCCRCLNCMGGPCRVNPTNALVFTEQMPEGYEPKPGDGQKKVMVVGAGPAGMEAARVCAERGYDVSIYDKSSVGGLLDFAASVKGGHEQLGRYKKYLSHMLEVEGVNVVEGQEVDADFVRKQNPDVVIVAVGGTRPEISLSGTDSTPVYSMADFMSQDFGDRVTVLGFNAQAVDVATYLLSQGKMVTVVSSEPATAYATGQSAMLLRYTKPAFLAAGGKILPESTIASVGDGEIAIKGASGVDATILCDAIVDASTMLPNTDLVDALGSDFKVYAVGDCSEPMNIQSAVTAANLVARNC